MALDELYQELLLDHFKNPRCVGTLSDASAESRVFNPLCGDQVMLNIKTDGERVEKVAFTGHGCSISQASASMMSELCNGKTIAEVHGFIQAFKDLMRGQEGESLPVLRDSLGDVLALEGVKKFSARIKCALLAWDAMERCLQSVKEKSEVQNPDSKTSSS